MKIIVTSAAGFIGRALATRLATAPVLPHQHLILVDQVAPPCPPGAEGRVGDIASPALWADLADLRADLIYHLAAVPGGASEADPRLSRRVNLDATLAMIEALAGSANRTRLIQSSSIGVFGAPRPPSVDDDTPPRPDMTYGAHKLMAETALADAVRRDDITALSLRVPGVVARPPDAAGLKSAFLSNLFDALRAGQPITLPVSAVGHVWITSLAQCIDNLVLAGTADWKPATGRPAITMPALHLAMGDLAAAAAAASGVDPALVRYAPEPALEATFAAYPPLSTKIAEAIGLRHDGDVAALVRRVFATL